ncbi:MAG: methyl-accepting chemotaxis protein [Candidatus Omnitrophica bacterium]|nr:methyl-accepting chemotaxis protein [Candidatus Omnitrophota bacterium]
MAENTARPRFKRKQYIVARKFQLKYTGVILLLMFITAGFCAYIVYYTTMVLFGEKLANVYPQGHLVAMVKLVNFRILAAMLVVSPLIGFLAIYLSHKIAGPIFRIERVLADMAKGDLSIRITLRRGDEMVSLADSVNRLTDAMASSIKSEKARVDSAIKELDSLKKSSSAHTVEKLDKEIRLLAKELEKYKV